MQEEIQKLESQLIHASQRSTLQLSVIERERSKLQIACNDIMKQCKELEETASKKDALEIEVKRLEDFKKEIQVEFQKQQQQWELDENQLNTKIDIDQMLLSDKIQKTQK